MAGWYIGGSAQIRTDVTNVVPDYRTRNTSDHYPVSSMYRVKMSREVNGLYSFLFEYFYH